VGLEHLEPALESGHEFKRFERSPGPQRGDQAAHRQLKIVCRCGWSSVLIDQDPDELIVISAAADLLQKHITEELSRLRNA